MLQFLLNVVVFVSGAVLMGLEIVGSSSEAMLLTMQVDAKKWAELIKATGIQIPQ